MTPPPADEPEQLDDAANLDPQEALRLLEAFVVDNEPLQRLESRIGRFNIFDALGIVHQELRHSNFLAWLLDPAESHGQGGLFLRAFLMDLLRQTPPGEQRLFSPVYLDGAELRGVEVRREWRNIDLLITCEEPSFVIAIENKVNSGEHSDQLNRYRKIIQGATELSKFDRPQYVFLTRRGDEPTDEAWTIYTYTDLHRALSRCRELNYTQMGEDVLAFLDHYLRLIGSQMMDDAKIVELCRDIYRNHRQAIDLITTTAKQQSSEQLDALYDLVVQQADRWVMLRKTNREINFIPRRWYDVIPGIGTRVRSDPKDWLFVTLWCYDKECWLNVAVRGVSQPDVRQACVDVLTGEGNSYGLKRKKKLSQGWNSLGRNNIMSFPQGELPDVEALLAKVLPMLDKLWGRLASADQVLAEAVARTYQTDST